MTSISSLFGSATSALTSTATVQPSDKTAFSSAITDILNNLKSGTSAATTAGATAVSTSTSSAGTSSSVQDKVDGLIDGEVSAGKLTSDQATQLKGLFAKAAGHMHHIHAPKSSSTDIASTDDDTTDALGVSTTDATSATDPLAALTSTSATTSASGTSTVMDEATSALGGLISGIKSAAAATGLYGSGGIAHSGIGSLLIHAFA